MNEVTSPQAFEGLRIAGRAVRCPGGTIAVADHNVPTDNRAGGVADVTLGSYRRLDMRATMNLPLARDLAMRVSAISRNARGWGRNLTNKVYRTNVIAFFGDEASRLGAPRTYGAEVAFKF